MSPTTTTFLTGASETQKIQTSCAKPLPSLQPRTLLGRDATARLGVHSATPGKSNLQQHVIFDNNLTKAEAEFLEQKIMYLNEGALSTNEVTNLLNRIRSYSSSNPNASIYDVAGHNPSWGRYVLSDALTKMKALGL